MYMFDMKNACSHMSRTIKSRVQRINCFWFVRIHRDREANHPPTHTLPFILAHKNMILLKLKLDYLYYIWLFTFKGFWLPECSTSTTHIFIKPNHHHPRPHSSFAHIGGWIYLLIRPNGQPHGGGSLCSVCVGRYISSQLTPINKIFPNDGRNIINKLVSAEHFNAQKYIINRRGTIGRMLLFILITAFSLPLHY